MVIRVNLPPEPMEANEEYGPWWRQQEWEFIGQQAFFIKGPVAEWCKIHDASPRYYEEDSDNDRYYMEFEDPNKAMLFKLSCL